MKTISKNLSKITVLAVLAATPAYAQMNHDAAHDMNKMVEMRQSHMVEALATVRAIDIANAKVNLAHDAIPQVSWPAMVMDFNVPTKIDLSALRVGDKVQLTLHRAPDGSLPLVELCKTSSEVVQPALCAPMQMDHGSMHDHGKQSDQNPKDHSQHKGH